MCDAAKLVTDIRASFGCCEGYVSYHHLGSFEPFESPQASNDEKAVARIYQATSSAIRKFICKSWGGVNMRDDGRMSGLCLLTCSGK